MVPTYLRISWSFIMIEDFDSKELNVTRYITVIKQESLVFYVMQILNKFMTMLLLLVCSVNSLKTRQANIKYFTPQMLMEIFIVW